MMQHLLPSFDSISPLACGRAMSTLAQIRSRRRVDSLRFGGRQVSVRLVSIAAIKQGDRSKLHAEVVPPFLTNEHSHCGNESAALNEHQNKKVVKIKPKLSGLIESNIPEVQHKNY